MTGHDWIRKVIYKELFKRLKFGYITKCVMQKKTLKNEMHRILWDFKIQTRPIAQKKKNSSGFGRFDGPLSKNRRKQKEKQIRGPCQRTKNLWNIRVMVIPIVIGAYETVPKSLMKRLEELEIRGRTETIQIGLKT